MAYAHVQTFQATPTQYGGATSVSESFTSTPAAGSLITALIAAYRSAGAPTISTVADNQTGNTYASAVTATAAGLNRAAIYYAYNVNSSGTFTVTVTPSAASDMCIAIGEYSGALTTDPIGSTNNGTGTSTTPSPGAVNPADANSLYVAMVTHNGATVAIGYNTGAGWTQRAEQETGATGEVIGAQDFIGSGSQTGSFTLASSQDWVALVATFKPAVGGTNYTVTVTDGIYMLDPQSKTEEHTQRDSSLFNDFMSRVEEHLQAESIFLSDTALAWAIRDLILTDQIFVDDQRVSTIDKALAEGLFLLDVLTKVEEHTLADFLFLFDSVSSDLTRVTLDILVTDGLYMLDEAVKLQEATQRDSLLLGDDRFSELLKLFLDNVLTRVDRSSGVDLTQADKLFINDLMAQVQEKMIPEGLFLSDDVVKTVVQAVTAALAYARLRAQDLLGITIGYSDSFLGERAESRDLLGVTAGWQRPYGD